MTQHDSIAVKDHQIVAPHVTILACLFAIFAFGMLLPLLYGVGVPFYSSAQIELPAMTSLFVNITPWMMIVIALVICTILTTLRRKGNLRVSQTFGWLSILFTAVVTLAGTLAFLLPIIAIMSGLRG